MSNNNSSVDFKSLAAQLLAGADGFLSNLFPNGKKNGNEWEIGSLDGEPGDSLKINMRSGLWKDFASGESGGDLISLYAAAKGLKQAEAAIELSGDTTQISSNTALAKVKPKIQDLFTPQIPPNKSLPDLDTLKHPKHGKPTIIYTYRDQGGNPYFYVCRFEFPDKGKEFAPYTYGSMNGALPAWKWKGMPYKRPLYNLHRIAELSSNGAEKLKRIVICEGEKTADALNSVLPKSQCVATTWCNGGNAYDKTDFSPLWSVCDENTKVILWPDNDEAGFKAMRSITGLMRSAECKALPVMLLPPPDVPLKWDAADAIYNDGWTARMVVDYIQAGVKAAKEAPEPLPSSNQSSIEVLPPEENNISYDDIPPAPQMNEYSGMMGGTLDFVSYNKNKPVLTVANLKVLLNSFGVSLKYNVITKDHEYVNPHIATSIDNRNDVMLGWIVDKCVDMQMGTGNIDLFITMIADQHQYNPIADWIASKPWDGTRRLGDFFNTVKSTNDSLKEILMTRWLVSAVAAAFEPDGISAGGVLVFTGEQYIGKTYWFTRLVPEGVLRRYIKDGLSLNPNDRDSVNACISNWLVELGELDATFRKSDIAALKAFFPKNRDVMRLSYGRALKTFPRRTVFFASVNPTDFLRDETGNRRYWVIECESIDYNHTIDMQQLWAEVYELYKAGERWLLTHPEVALLNESNKKHEAGETLFDKVDSFYDWEKEPTDWKTSSEILDEMGIRNQNPGDAKKIGIYIKKKTGKKSMEIKRKRCHLMPQKRDKTMQDTVDLYPEERLMLNLSHEVKKSEGFD